MRVLAHLLAAGADYHPDSTFTVFHAGITTIQSATWPVMMPVAIVTRLELAEEEARQLQQLRFRITHDGNEIGSSPPQALAVRVDRPGLPIYVNAISNVGLLIPRPGRLTISAFVNEAALPPLYLTALPIA